MPSDSPVFLLSAPRSGSTLLSSLIALHPSFVNAGEANFVNVLMSMSEARLITRDLTDTELSEPFVDPGLENIDELRLLADNFYRSYLSVDDQTRVCDKSLPNVMGAPLLAQVWPRAKFIAIFRNSADFIQSSIMTGPWGLSGYGFEPYVAASPSNAVMALTRYWIERVQTIKHFANENAERFMAVRYEDLVDDPDRLMNLIWEFLEVDGFGGAINQGFSEKRQLRTPRDHKIRHTSRVHSDSVGRGQRIPIGDLVPPQIVEAANQELAALGYKRIDAMWGCAGDVMKPGEVFSPVESAGSGHWTWNSDPVVGNDSKDRIEASLQAVEGDRSPVREENSGQLDQRNIAVKLFRGRTLEFVGEIDMASGELQESNPGEVLPLGILVVGLEALMAISVGYIDFGDAFRRGDFRYYALNMEGTPRRVEDGEPIVEIIGDVMVNAAKTLLDESEISTGYVAIRIAETSSKIGI